MKVHDTKTVYTKIIAVEHGLSLQLAVTGRGKGEFVILEGPAQIHKVVHELLKIDIVYQVACDLNMIRVTVFEPHRWDEIIGEVQHIIGRYIGGEL